MNARVALVSALFVLSMLFLATPVLGIELFGEEYSLLVLLPIPIILLMVLVFIGLLIHDFLTRAGKKPKKPASAAAPPPSRNAAESPRPVSASHAPVRSSKAAPLLRWLRRFFPRKSASKPRSLQNLEAYEHTLEILEGIEHELPYSDSYKVFENLIKTIRTFFSRYLNINYEFTYEELEKELSKKNKDIIFFPKNLSRLHYSPAGYSKDELRGLITEFRSIITKLADTERDRLKGFNNHSLGTSHHAKIRKIDDLIAEGRRLLSKSPKQALKIYRDIYAAHHNLTSAEKRMVGQRITKFHTDLQKHI